jgi:hypothetical protein
MNNIVWSCCVLHNLLLGYDRLDLLWTDADVLSTWYADADAELGHDFDLGADVHQQIVEKRANRRCRLFRSSTLGKSRPSQNRQPAPGGNEARFDDEGVILTG